MKAIRFSRRVKWISAFLVFMMVMLPVIHFYSSVPAHDAINPVYWIRRGWGLDLYDPESKYLWHGNRSLREIALTIDDGPHEPHCSAILDLLKQRGIRATFFLVGQRAKEHPEVVRRMLAEGHEIGNHSNSHLRLTQIPEHNMRNEIRDCAINVDRAAGVKMRFFRPPGMNSNESVLAEARKHGYITIGWTAGSGDYVNTTAEHIVNRTLRRVENGAILLLHDERQATVDAMPRLIDEAERQGYRFVTISEMLEHLPEGTALRN